MAGLTLPPPTTNGKIVSAGMTISFLPVRKAPTVPAPAPVAAPMAAPFDPPAMAPIMAPATVPPPMYLASWPKWEFPSTRTVAVEIYPPPARVNSRVMEAGFLRRPELIAWITRPLTWVPGAITLRPFTTTGSVTTPENVCPALATAESNLSFNRTWTSVPGGSVTARAMVDDIAADHARARDNTKMLWTRKLNFIWPPPSPENEKSLRILKSQVSRIVHPWDVPRQIFGGSL